MNIETKIELGESGDHWSSLAACNELLIGDPATFDEYFFPETTGCKALTKMAKKICAACPVQVECLEESLTNYDRYGIKGGLAPHEREHLQRQRRIPEQRLPDGA